MPGDPRLFLTCYILHSDVLRGFVNQICTCVFILHFMQLTKSIKKKGDHETPYLSFDYMFGLSHVNEHSSDLF